MSVEFNVERDESDGFQWERAIVQAERQRIAGEIEEWLERFLVTDWSKEVATWQEALTGDLEAIIDPEEQTNG